jgi:hypothetical protein
MTMYHDHKQRATISAFSPKDGSGDPVYPYSGGGASGDSRDVYQGPNPQGGSLQSSSWLGGGGWQGSGLPVPYSPSFPGQGGGGFGGFQMQELKNFIDRMGGIDGILNMLTKASKLMSTLQQMAPMLKLLLPFGSKAATNDLEIDDRPRRRRRRRRRSKKLRRRRRSSNRGAA